VSRDSAHAQWPRTHFQWKSTGNVTTHNSRTGRHRVFKLGNKVGHVTFHAQQLFKVKRSKVNVTKSRDVSAVKIGSVWSYRLQTLWKLSTWGSTRVVYILNQQVKQTGSKKIWRTFKLLNAKVNVKRRQIAEILHSNRKSGSTNRTPVSKFTAEVYK